ncbi:MAG: hypothetical protein A3I75_05700 [Deltaproteobacteria bacterium RIFCSPLOWO2_02_FULL_50_16]|nr:MAG: hypothetical protein A2053_01850 [Deltaproteobacteria bacterium GWA2_50_8]OGQ31522.1 MAG: hypothetical protein A3B79_00440 [Deltaproteobacteria bacterium RIFCSPHIGHO2_02_FULL_50_15]OGQ56784.1 MAG: hypothetical protein A3I75_05700 [Deltaproteobacteria bacterium RIFCSPLOWO2_02_FULL_50_16]OGQ67309.1 MAG: hypothetical protein A3F89_04535 [Deltaproteobacteria bacterium RIFCSPLOWO2_12_FULL_50_11]
MSWEKVKRGLVLEGGGARGAHTAGMLMALIEAGLPPFDVVCATSAGASTGAYFVAHQTNDLMPVWLETFRTKNFLNLKRILTRKSVMDFDYLVDEIFAKVVPLNYQAINNNPCDFFICATDCETGQPHYFKNRKDPIPLALKASGAIPLAYKTPILINGKRYVDGGISDSIPVQKAIDEGCQEIWILLSQREGYRKKPMSYFPWKLTSFRHYPQLIEAIRNRHIHYNKTLDLIASPPSPVRFYSFAPQSPLPLRRFTSDLAKIHQACAQGRQDAIVCLTKGPGFNKMKS